MGLASGVKVTIYDVAAAAGVSPATVSRVLNHREQVAAPTRDKVLDAIGRLGFEHTAKEAHPQSRRSGDTEKAAATNPLLLFNVPSMINPFYGDIVRGAQAAADKNGYHMLVDCRSINSMNMVSLINLIRNFNVGGLVVADAVPDLMLDPLLEVVPVVQCCEYNPDSDISFVSIDNYAASKKAVEYILSAGRRRILLFCTPLRFLYARQRQKGYEDTLAAAGIPVRREWIAYVPEIDFDLAFQAARTFFRSTPIPDAVFAVSDVLASAAIKAALEADLSVPKDVMVVGFDNVDISRTTTPTITTVGQPRYQLGYRAVEMLIEKVMGLSYHSQQAFLGTELIIRESSTL